MSQRLARCLSALLAVLLLITCVLPPEAAKAVVLEGYVAPTYPANADVYDAEHPETLNDDMLLCEAAILIEASSGMVIYEKNADQRMAPASTTKIMTVLLGLMMGDVTDTVTVSDLAVDLPSDSSTIPLKAGEQINVKDLLYATMIRSGNDGANVIAEYVSGSIDGFVNMMNNVAGMMGCTNTHFSNPTGLDADDHYTTARDLAIITQNAMQNETFKQIAGTYEYTRARTNLQAAQSMTSGKSYIMSPTLNAEGKYYYQYCQGVKTGTTGKAGYCFVGYAEKDGISLISVVLYSSQYGRWTDTKRLMEYGFSQYVSVTPEELYQLYPFTIQTTGYALDDADLGTLALRLEKTGTDTVNIITTQSEVENLARQLKNLAMVTYSRDFAAPITAGETLGTLAYYDQSSGNTVEYNLVATRSVARRENAPKSIAEIEAETYADGNPFPPISVELVLMLLLPVLALVALIAIIRKLRYRIGRGRKSKIPKTDNRMFR